MTRTTSPTRAPSPPSTKVVKLFYTERVSSEDQTAHGGALGLYFFLSYAHGDPADNTRVATFAHDLSVEVRTLTGDDQNEVVGFHDSRDLRAGDAWPRELVTALSHARTFVALCSPRYFKSIFCGKEWTVFAGRVDAYEIRNHRHPSSIIPVFWVPTEVPSGLGDIQHRDQSFGGRYEEMGLRELMRLNHQRDYATFVRALAIRVRQVAEEFPLPPAHDQANFHTVPSAFTPAAPALTPPASGPERPGVAQPGVPHPRRRDRPHDLPPPPPRPILALEPCDPLDPDRQLDEQ